MSSLTITEALAEIKTIGKRKESKQQSIAQYVARLEKMRDPLEKDGGSAEFIRRELQAIRDLDERIVQIRRAIMEANHATTVTIAEETRSIYDWLTWRKEVAPSRRALLAGLRDGVNRVRREAQQKGLQVQGAVSVAAVAGSSAPVPDVIVNVDEAWLAKEIERVETILGTLDGQLSLKNATTFVTLPD